MVEFGEQLRKAREAKGLTQQTLAEQLFVTRQAVSKWECGERYPDLPTTKKISEALDVSLDDLLSGKDMNKVIERNSIVDNNLAEKVIFTVYAVFLFRCLSMISTDFFTCRFIKETTTYAYFHADSFFNENTAWIMMPKIIFCALTLVLIYGFIHVAKGTLSPKITGIIGIVTFATSSLIHVTQIITFKIMPLIFAEPLKYNFSIDTLTSVIKPNLLYVILILIPAVIGVVATLFYFIRGNNKIVWKVLFIIMTTSEIIITYKFAISWQNKLNSYLPSLSQRDFFRIFAWLEGANSEKYTYCGAIYVFLLFQAVALWIKKIKATRAAESSKIPQVSEA